MGFEYPAFLVDFSDALRAIKAGKKVYRPYWAQAYGQPVGRHLALWVGPGTAPMLMIMQDDGLLYPMSGSHMDMLADDWEIME